MHNKLFIADSAIAVAGGRNIADEYFMRSMTDNFVDMDALIVGAVVPPLVNIFDTLLEQPSRLPGGRRDQDRSAHGRRCMQRFNALVDEGEQMMALTLPPVDILGYGPISDDMRDGQLGLHWGKATAFADSPEKVTATSDDEARKMSVTMSVMDLVIASRDEVVLSSPYFVPGTMGVQAFGDLTKRKVKVTILTNSLASNDEPLVHTGYARYRHDLLRTGVDLYELSPTRSQKNKRLMIPGASRGPPARQDGGRRSQPRVHRLDEPRPALGEQEHRARHHHREPRARQGGAAGDPHQQAAKRLPAAAREATGRASSG